MKKGDITISPERIAKMDFTIPIATSNIIIFKQNSGSMKSGLFSFMEPFSSMIWASILLSVIIGKQI